MSQVSVNDENSFEITVSEAKLGSDSISLEGFKTYVEESSNELETPTTINDFFQSILEKLSKMEENSSRSNSDRGISPILFAVFVVAILPILQDVISNYINNNIFNDDEVKSIAVEKDSIITSYRIVNRVRLTIRKVPDRSSQSLLVLKKNDLVVVDESKQLDEWILVTYVSSDESIKVKGWVLKKYLTLLN